MGTSALCLNPQRQSKDKQTKCVSVFLCMSAKPEPRWAMPVGSCTAWNTVSSQMDRCLLTRLLGREWRRESSQRPEKTWLPWRRIMKKLALTAWERRMKRERSIDEPNIIQALPSHIPRVIMNITHSQHSDNLWW